MKPSRFIAAVAILSLFSAGPAASAERSGKLSGVASIFAMHAVDVRCPTVEEWAADPNSARAWSYAHLRDDYAVLRPGLCAGALAPEDRRIAAWERAAGVLALVHEAYHLRRWSHRRDEEKVMCQAIRHFRVGARLLGASPEGANELLPYALALHWRTMRFFSFYRSASCVVPAWVPPGESP